MEKIHELLGYERIKIIQRDDTFSFSLDSMLLASFVNCNEKTKNIIELGCGNGPILLYLTLKTKAKLTGIEIQEEIYNLCKRSVELNGFTNQIEVINDDLRGIYKKVGHDKYDIVISNPPFFKYLDSSIINKNDYLTIARHEVMCTLDDIVSEAKKLLIDGGSLVMVHRASRLSEVIETMKQHNFGIKRLRFIYPVENSEEALMFLIEARHNRKDDCKVLKPLYVYDEKRNYTEEVLKIFNFKR